MNQMKTDRELLELAARAAGLPYVKPAEDYDGSLGIEAGSENPMRCVTWNPLTNDGDALRLAVKLNIPVLPGKQWATACVNWLAGTPYSEPVKSDALFATRRAIVLAAAAIGEGMQ